MIYYKSKYLRMDTAEYIFKLLSGDIIPVSFTYNISDFSNFRLSFVKECRRIFPDILYDQILIFDEENVYDLENIKDIKDIKDNGYIFNVFINDKESVLDIFKKENSIYSKWKGEEYKTYIINIQSSFYSKEFKMLKVTAVYCGSTNNTIFTFFFENIGELRRRTNDIGDRWFFANEKARYRYFFETGLIEL